MILRASVFKGEREGLQYLKGKGKALEKEKFYVCVHIYIYIERERERERERETWFRSVTQAGVQWCNLSSVEP